MSWIFWYLWKQEIISHSVTNVFIRHGYNSIEPLTIYTRNKPWLYFLHQILSSNNLLLIVEWKVSKHCQDCGNGLEKYNDIFDVYEYMSLYFILYHHSKSRFLWSFPLTKRVRSSFANKWELAYTICRPVTFQRPYIKLWSRILN